MTPTRFVDAWGLWGGGAALALGCGGSGSHAAGTDASTMYEAGRSTDAPASGLDATTLDASNDASTSDGGRSEGGNASGNLNYPLLGTYNLGGDQTLYAGEAWQTWAGKFHVDIVSDYIGLEQAMQQTMPDVFASVKTHGAANGIAPKCLIYTIDEVVPFTRGGTAPTNSTYETLWTAVNDNNWFLRTTWPSGSIVTNQYSTALAQVNNGVDTTKDSSGRYAMQYFSWYWNQVLIEGNAVILGESQTVALDPVCDGFFHDNQFWTPRVSGDWLENGTTQTASSSGTPPITAAIQQGHAQAIVAMQSYNPALMNMGNNDWYATSVSTIDPSCRGLYDAQLFEAAIGESYSVEEYATWDQLMTNMIAAEPLVTANGFSLFGQYNASGTNAWPQDQSDWNASHYQGMRYGLATALQRGYYYNAESGTPATLWYFDEFDGGSVDKVGYLGPPVDPPQTAAWQNGVWRRRYANGAAFVNPKGNGPQTVTLGTTLYHLHGAEQPTINTGQPATTVMLQDRDGIIMLNSAPP
jgi:hypothetical protein